MKLMLYCICCFLGIGLFYPLSVLGKPMGGKISRQILINEKANGTCTKIGLYNRSTVAIQVKANKQDIVTNVTLFATVYKTRCANVELDYPPCGDYDQKIAVSNINLTLDSTSISPIFFFDISTESDVQDDSFTTLPPSENSTDAKTQTSTPTIVPASNANKRAADGQVKLNPVHPFLSIHNGSAMYIIEVLGKTSKNVSVLLTLNFEMKNPHGFLSAVDYPALVFYGTMTAVYAVYAIVWIVLMGCSYKDLVRLQFWVLAVILLGFLEKTFFVSEYSSLNAGESASSSELFLVAEAVSAGKRAVSRMLLIIVSLGFGTVKPRLGDSLGKVIAAGIAYFILALIDGVVRARMDTFTTGDTSVVVTLVLLLLLDCLIFYWIFSSIVATRMALRLRKNYVKLSMYNHFAYALIFGIIASVAFLIWTFVELSFPPDSCLDDWKEVWLRDCFWHILFAFILLIVMVIWRPSSNRSRFAYSLVNDEDNEEPEQGENKNFETLKMRSVGKQGSVSEPPPVSSSQVEDDLRWVEENLPTTALDKALPLLLDSDEEVMTTKFEISKMN